MSPACFIHTSWILSLFSASILTATGQEAPVKEFKRNKVKSVTVSATKATSYYDRNGRITMLIKPINESTADTVFYYYDEAGNNVKIVDRHFTRPLKYEKSEFIDVFLYDAKKRLIQHEHHRDSRIISRDKYFYSAIDRLDSVQIFYNFYWMPEDQHDSLVLNWTQIYTYDSQKRLIKETRSHSTKTYEYNDKKLIKEIATSFYQPCRGKGYMLTQTSVFKYTNGILTDVEITWTNEIDEPYPTVLRSYSYDDKGKIIKEASTTISQYSDHQIRDTSIKEFIYDHQGLKIKETTVSTHHLTGKPTIEKSILDYHYQFY